MAAECEFVLGSGRACSVVAISRCSECEQAFCRAHGAGGKCRQCQEKEKANRWVNRFEPVEYCAAARPEDESEATYLLIMAVNRIAQAGLILRTVRGALDLGDGRQPALEGRVAWAVLQELVLIGWYTSRDELRDREIWESPYESAVREQYERSPIVCPVPNVLSLRGEWTEEPGFRQGAMAALRSRRPSGNLTQAWLAFIVPLRQAEEELAALPPAAYSDLVQYLRGGTSQEPDDWSRANKTRLEAVPWPTLARALLDAGVEARRRIAEREVTVIFGRKRFVGVAGWSLPVAGVSPGTWSPPTRALTVDGTVVDGRGVIEKNPGKASPSVYRNLALTHPHR